MVKHEFLWRIICADILENFKWHYFVNLFYLNIDEKCMYVDVLLKAAEYFSTVEDIYGIYKC